MEHAKKNCGRAMFSILAETMVNYEIVMKIIFDVAEMKLFRLLVLF